MRIWKLSPTNLADPIWKLWSPEPIIVRAETASEARLLAELKTAKFLHTKWGQEKTINPWGGYKKIGDPAPPPIVSEDITEQTDKYSVDGPAEVLHHGEKF